MNNIDIEQNLPQPLTGRNSNANNGADASTSAAELAALVALCIALHNTATNIPLPAEASSRLLLNFALGAMALAVVSSLTAVVSLHSATVCIPFIKKGMALRGLAIFMAFILAVVAVVLMTVARMTDSPVG